MPEIHFAADKFRAGAVRATGSVEAPEADLLSTAVRMGDVSVFGGPRRPLVELLWAGAPLGF